MSDDIPEDEDFIGLTEEELEDLVDSGALVRSQNEFDETVISIGDGELLRELAPSLAAGFHDEIQGLMDALMAAGWVASRLNDDMEEVFYATDDGEQVFEMLILARRVKRMEDFQLDLGN